MSTGNSSNLTGMDGHPHWSLHSLNVICLLAEISHHRVFLVHFMALDDKNNAH